MEDSPHYDYDYDPNGLVPLDGKRLRHHRIAAGYTLERLGARAGVSWTTLQRLERRGTQATARTVRKVAEALAIDAATLLDDAR